MRAPSDKNQVQVIARAAHILRALEGEDAGLSLGQIAARVGLARSTVQRIVASLETEKLLIAASPNGRVRLGPAILRLASSVTGDFVARARPHLTRLSEELCETVDLATVRRDHLMFIDQVIGTAILVAVIFRALDALRVFDLIYVLTPNNAETKTMSVFAQENLFQFDNFAYGSAASTLLFLVIALSTIAYIRLSRLNLSGDR